MSTFSLLIRKWYRQNKRDLPWRNTLNPYFIWLSEIILQQTRVAQGLPYYMKFTSEFPTIEDLANAPENHVLRLWQGLGYYSRARNLHQAAKQVVELHNGIFPNDYKSIKQLKGVGEYTAAAICSFSFGLPYPVVDGNVFRVLARYYNENTPIDTTNGKKIFNLLANEVFDSNNAAEHNQAIMELGALICTPKSPSCFSCPLAETCLANRKNTINELPIKAKKVKVRKRYFNYLIDIDSPIIYKREGQDIWKNMFEFPMIESKKEITPQSLKSLTSNDWSFDPSIHKKPIASIKHILSHQHIYATFWYVSNLNSNNDAILVKSYHLKEDYPLPRIISRFIEENE